LITGNPQPAAGLHPTQGQVKEGTGPRFQLFRIGDAVSARNTHAAVYDALRLVKDL
jgi:hypothetical protein